MATEMKMPQLSDTMDKGKILGWRKKEGDAVARGDILAEVETDKANLEIECFTPGTLLKILVPAGSTAVVGEAIAVLGNPGEAVAPSGKASSSDNASRTSRSGAAPSPSIAPPPHQNGSSSQTHGHTPAPSSFSTGGAFSSGSVSPAQENRAEGRIRASPLAKKLAEQHAINLATISGSGPDGRIVKRDVESQVQSATAPISPSFGTRGAGFSTSGSPGGLARPLSPRSAGDAQLARAPNITPPAEQMGPSAAARSYPLTKMRETIARRMQESVTQAPHFYVTTSIDMDAALQLREALKEDSAFKGISVNHLVIKACAYALAKEPRVNRSLRDGMVYEPAEINVGIITAVEDGLLIPVVRNADTLSLEAIVFESRAAIERARAGRPTASDLSGGTFSISNMGMLDVENFTAIISPGQGGVLAVSAVQEVPVVRNGSIVAGKRMKVTLSVDHRVIDGVMAAEWLGHFKRALQIPGLLMRTLN